MSAWGDSWGPIGGLTAAEVWAYAARTLTSVATPSAASIAAAVRTELAIELARLNVTVGSRNAIAPDNAGILAAIAGITVTDPLLATVPGAYPVGTAGNAIGKLNAVAAAGPVTVIPGPPPDSSMCRLYGYFETVTNAPAAWLGFTITLVGASPIRSTRTLAGLSVVATTDAEGRLSDGANPWIDVQRNDMLGPATDTQYRITCDLAGINILVTLNTESADMMALVFPASAPPPPPPSAVATNPRFGYAPALLAGNNTGLAALFSSMVSLMGSASGGTTGMFNTVASTTNFTWIAVLASAAGPDIRVFDGIGYGGFSGAGSPGLYAPGEIDPSAISLPYTDGNANLWKMFRSDGKAVTYSTFTLS